MWQSFDFKKMAQYATQRATLNLVRKTLDELIISLSGHVNWAPWSYIYWSKTNFLNKTNTMAIYIFYVFYCI